MEKKVICKVLKNIRDNGKDYKPGDEITLEKSRAEIFAREGIGHVEILRTAEDAKNAKK